MRRATVAGQIVGQLSLVAVVPILTRIVDIDQMGYYQLAFALALILQPLATVRVEFAIPGAHSREVQRLLRLGRVWACLALLLPLTLAIALWLVGSSSMATALAAMGFILLAYGVTAIENAELVRRSLFGILGWRHAFSGLIAALLQIVFALAFPSALALALALVLGRLLVIVVIRAPKELSADSTTESALPLGQRYTSDRMMFAVTSGIVANSATQSLVVLAFVFYGSEGAALVGIAQRVAAVPITLLGQSLSQVMLADAAVVVRRRVPGLAALVESRFRRLAILALGTSLLLGVGGPVLAGPILGDAWSDVGLLIALLAVPLGFHLVAVVPSPLFTLLHSERLSVLIQVGRLLSISAAMSAATYLDYSMFAAIGSAGAAWALGTCVFLLIVLRIVRLWDRRIADEA